MNPDAVLEFRKAEAEALSEAIEIGAITQATHKPIAGERYEQEIGQ